MCSSDLKRWHEGVETLLKAHSDLKIERNRTYHRHIASLVATCADVSKLEAAYEIACERRKKVNSEAPVNFGLIASILKTQNFDKPKKEVSQQADFKPVFVEFKNEEAKRPIPEDVRARLDQLRRQLQ